MRPNPGCDERPAAVPRAVAVMKDGGGTYAFRFADHDELLAAWTAGRAFYTGTGPFGETVTLKLAGVESVVRWTGDALAAHDAHRARAEAARKRRELLGEGGP